MVDPIALGDFQAIAEEFAAKYLGDYNAALKKRGHNPGRKEINDPLWGTIGLIGPEVAVLDSPLLQRLRLIRQLGVVHWVYPGALHTRFEHTLGVLRQVQYLCEAINNLGAQQNIRDLIDPNKVNLLRLAALFHDIGHAAFSHVSEHAIETLDALSSLPSEFAREHRAETRSLSEIFAYFVVRSRAMKSFLRTLIDHDGSYIKLNNNRNSNIEEIIEKISHTIIGRKIDDRIPLLHEIISGPFDADKLDYFKRDAHAAGVPSLLDISRLIQKLAIREFDSTDLPGATGRDVRALGQRHILVGIKWSGISVLDELHLSRVLLYSKIYRHPKVIAIEEMVSSALRVLANASDIKRILNLVYNFNDDALLSMPPMALAASLEIDFQEASDDTKERVAKASRIFEDIRLRRLAIKAFQLQRIYPGDPLQSDEKQRAGLVDFREIIDHPVNRETFRQKLISEIERIIQFADLAKVSRTDLEGNITIHPVGKTPGGTQIGRAWLLPNSGEPLEFRNYLVNRTAWADSYLSDQPAGYVFADETLADVTYIAMERVLRTDHEVRLPTSALESSKRDMGAIQHLKQRLGVAGYFNDAPFDIRPLPSRLAHADVARVISVFVPKLEAYQPPITDDDATPLLPDVAVRSWLRQFDNDDDVECAAKLLDAVRIIDRRDTVAAVRAFLNVTPAFKDGLVVPFGSARDSSAIHSYFAADLQGTDISECLALDEAVIRHGGRPIIFVDDFVGSGGQSRDVLAAGFGRDDLRADLGERRNLFTNDIQSFLMEAQIGFVFTAAWDDGIKEVEKTASELGLKASVYRLLDEGDIPFVDQALTGLPQHQIDAFLARSRNIGTSILEAGTQRREGESDGDWTKRLKGRALGYGNRGMLLASPFNVPTQTFTPLWARGSVNGAAWIPLLPRRKKG